MRKIIIGGSIGAGKSTLAKALSRKLNIPHVELDNFYWLPEWQVRPMDQLKNLVEKTTSAQEWIICGNYSKLKEFTTDRADTIIWLDYPFLTCFWQALKRYIRNIINKQKCCNGNQETWGRLFFSKNSILLWLISTFRQRNKRYAAMFTTEKDLFYKDKTFVRLKSHKQAKSWLEKIC